MIADTDTLCLPPGVATVDGRLADVVRQASWPLNASAAFVLARAGRTFGEIAEETAAAFAVPLETARADVLRFAWTLNTLALANLERGEAPLHALASWVRLALRLAPAGALPAAVTRRHNVDTSRARNAVLSVFAAIAWRIVVVGLGSTMVAAQPAAAVQGARGLLAAGALGLGTGAGIGIHEAAHAASLRHVPAALVTRGPRTFVLHARLTPARRSCVAVAGPLAAVGLGLALIVTGLMVAAPTLVLLGAPLVAHALALTVLGGDGRVVCGL